MQQTQIQGWQGCASNEHGIASLAWHAHASTNLPLHTTLLPWLSTFHRFLGHEQCPASLALHTTLRLEQCFPGSAHTCLYTLHGSHTPWQPHASAHTRLCTHASAHSMAATCTEQKSTRQCAHSACAHAAFHCMQVHVHAYTYVYTHMHMYMHMHTHTRVRSCWHALTLVAAAALHPPNQVHQIHNIRVLAKIVSGSTRKNMHAHTQKHARANKPTRTHTHAHTLTLVASRAASS